MWSVLVLVVALVALGSGKYCILLYLSYSCIVVFLKEYGGKVFKVFAGCQNLSYIVAYPSSNVFQNVPKKEVPCFSYGPADK